MIQSFQLVLLKTPLDHNKICLLPCHDLVFLPRIPLIVCDLLTSQTVFVLFIVNKLSEETNACCLSCPVSILIINIIRVNNCRVIQILRKSLKKVTVV